jgi:hypothetical protein
MDWNNYRWLWSEGIWLRWNDPDKGRGDRPEMLTNEQASGVDWSAYKQLKVRLIGLLACWIPFGALIGVLLPAILHTFTITYGLAAAYALYTGFVWLQYGFYSCPNCGLAYRGRQLWRRTCPKCGIEINP